MTEVFDGRYKSANAIGASGKCWGRELKQDAQVEAGTGIGVTRNDEGLCNSNRNESGDCDEEELVIRTNRVRKLSNHLIVRPPKSVLKQRNILKKDEVEAPIQEAADKLARMNIMHNLNEKIKRRPSVQELQERNILRFDEVVVVGVALSPVMYNRRSSKSWTRLTGQEKASIRQELNEFKSNMDVHEESRQYTRFHK
eukprot:Nk52_evm119s352 gene=Nk52_evmTU119s352